MQTITFELETITPMFMGGYNQTEFELRPPSLKGLLRFWWRAYYWGNWGNEKQLTLHELQEREGEIFGTATDNGKKSPFSLRVDSSRLTPIRTLFGENKKHTVYEKNKPPCNILEYLAYGPYERHSRLGRDYAPVGSQFSLAITLHDGTVIDDVIKSVYLLSVFGAIGSKAHNGFGNFTIKQVTDETKQPCLIDFPLSFPTCTFLQEHIKNGITPDNLPDFTAFSRQMKIFELPPPLFDSWDDCLASLGKMYYRSKSLLTSNQKHYIGSPVNKCEDRQAKPYFLKVIPVRKQFKGYIIYLPSQHGKTQNNEKEARACLEQFNNSLIQHDMKEVTIWQNL